eukprot:7070034-Pyramimonas_sp.AAC.1
MFQAPALSALHSGLEALVLQTREIKRLDVFVASLGRKWLKSRACLKVTLPDGTVHVTGVPNADARKKSWARHPVTLSY